MTFKCDGAVETFLPRAINYALTAAADFLQQFVIAQVSKHLRRSARVPLRAHAAAFAFRSRSAVLSLVHASKPRPLSRRQPGQPPSGASAGISAPHFGQSLSALIIVGEPLCTPLLLLRKIPCRGYARTTAIRWRNSSSISPGIATVWAISSRNNVW